MKRILLMAFIVVSLIIPSFATGQSIHPWPMYGGNAKRTGQTFVERATNGVIKWKLYVGQKSRFTAVVTAADEYIHSQKMVCLNISMQ